MKSVQSKIDIKTKFTECYTKRKIVFDNGIVLIDCKFCCAYDLGEIVFYLGDCAVQSEEKFVLV